MEKEVETAFTVVLHTDGTFVANLEQLDEPVEVKRAATVNDLATVSAQLVKEIDEQQLVSRIANALASLMAPAPEMSIPEVLKEKLKERNITPEE
jgi:hypothetical protein